MRRFFVSSVISSVLLSGCASYSRLEPKQQSLVPDCSPVPLRSSTRFSFEEFDTGLPRAGQWRDGFDLADMNGDGLIDLLHGPPRKGQPKPVIFLGDGKAQFSEWKTTHFPPLEYDYGDAKAADFNGDGLMDFALGVHLRGLVALISEGNGSYAPWGEGLGLVNPANRSTESAFASRAIAITDWDGDGRPDLLAANEGPALYAPVSRSTDAFALFLNRNGLWERVVVANPARGFGSALEIGDINGDGKPDAVLGSALSGANLLLQFNDNDAFQSQALRALPSEVEVLAVALFDLDNDKKAELIHATRGVVSGSYCAALHAVKFGANTQSVLPLWTDTSRNPIVAMVVGDIDSDGRADLLAIRESGAILSFAGSTNGFTRDVEWAAPPELAGCVPADAKLRDLDGDGQLELLISYAGDAFVTSGPSCASGGGFQAWRLRGR